MKAIKGVYQEGSIALAEKAPQTGPVEVVVVFPDSELDPWDEILEETAPRASFLEFAAEVEREIAEGKDEPLDMDRL